MFGAPRPYRLGCDRRHHPFVLSQKQTWAIGRTFNVFAKMAARSIAKALPAEVCETYLTESGANSSTQSR